MAHWTRYEREQEKDVRKLISSLTGLDDESGNNYQLALQYAGSNFRFHHYLDVSSHNIHRTLDGIYEKFVIHSDLSKAESWKRLTGEFLNLPLPSIEGTQEEEPFDWGKYLMEGEDIGLSADDTPEWSDISEEEDDQETLSREDSGIQVDRTPLDDGEKKSAAPVVSWKELVSTAEKESLKAESGSEPQLLPHLVTPTEPKEQQIHCMFLLRVKLMHFVNSLHNYMMTRILHSTGLEFQHQVEEAKDLDQLIKIHYRYLSTIHDRCLLREKVSSVKEAIMKVMNVVLMFADRWHAGFGAWKAESILKMESDFTNCHKFLVKVLNKAVCRWSFPHLESLALSLMAGMEQS
ncbi:gamma-tubulin complex component 5-like isoform X4 [Rhinoderma darwinii]|uniref:gamma-tubulin complex component 5-like isoform X4 n=1 Tax=Rhinoderma darwinii TaxID=43563 RepID=UPI003F673664